MAKVKVVPTAARRPGRCAISKETQGPFIDTGHDIPRFGRVYLSLKWLEPLLRNNGVVNFIPESEVTELRDQVSAAIEARNEAESRAADFDALVEAVTPYLPQPEPEVQEVVRVEHRAPTDEEIEEWIETRGGDHPAVLRARPLEKGSTEQWQALYGTSGPAKKEKTPEVTEDPSENPNVDEGPAKVVLLHDQEVDLDEVLKQNVKEVEAYAEDKPDEFIAALVRREFHLAAQDGRNVRKGVLAPLGYWDDEDDEPLVPVDEEENEEENEDGNGKEGPSADYALI